MKNTAILLIPSDDSAPNLQTNGVPYVRIINVIKTYEKLLAQKLVAEGEKIVGKDYYKLEKWLDEQITADQERMNEDGLNMN